MINMIFRLASVSPIGEWIAKVRRINERLALFAQVRSERRHLKQLDDRLLQDIGVSRAAAQHEVERAYWDVPSNRLPDTQSGQASKPLVPMVPIRPMS